MHYDVCISFEGAYRDYARELANALKREGIHTFFDEFEQARLWGMFLHDELGKIYSSEAYFCIVLLSSDYYAKMYPDRERRSALLHQGQHKPDYILPIKMDDSEIHISLQGLAYLDSREESISEIVNKLKEKLSFDDKRIKESVLAKMGRRQFDDAARTAKLFLQKTGYELGRPIDSKHAPAVGILLYNIACCLSRMVKVENYQAPEEQARLDEALRYAAHWLIDPSLRPAVADNNVAVGIFNRDDDLFNLRNLRTAQLQELFVQAGQSEQVKVQLTGDVRSEIEGCVIGTTRLMTEHGEKLAVALAVEDSVIGYDFHIHQKTASNRVSDIMTSVVSQLFIVNDKITVSGSQQFFEETLGWTRCSNLALGMRLLRFDGSYEPICSIVILDTKHVVYGVSVDSKDHSFVANGYVCHNKK